MRAAAARSAMARGVETSGAGKGHAGDGDRWLQRRGAAGGDDRISARWGGSGMSLHDYHCIKEHFANALTEAGFEVRVEEAILLSDGMRECRLLAYPEGEDSMYVWAELSYEWTVENQALWNFLDQELQQGRSIDVAEDEDGAEFFINGTFHMRLGDLACTPEDMRGVADRIRQFTADLVPSGSVVTEVSLTSEGARLEELRYQTSGTQAIVDDSYWWDGWAEIFRSIVHEMLGAYHELARRAGMP